MSYLTCRMAFKQPMLAHRPAWLQALVQAGSDDDDSSDGEWVAASEDETAVDADDTGECRKPPRYATLRLVRVPSQ